jgi:excisionase family DNA binding protein
VTVRDAAARLEVASTVVYNLCSKGLIEHRRIGVRRGGIRITEQALADYIERCTVAARDPLPKSRAGGTGLAVRDFIGEALAEEARRAGGSAGRPRGGDRPAG